MSKAARILVVGRALPFRDELYEHREIETRWAVNAHQVAVHLRESRVDACVIAPDFSDQDVVWLIRQSLGKAPCIVLVEGELDAAKWRTDSATVIVPVHRVDSLVLLLAEHTGLRLARYPRADVHAPVMVEWQGHVYQRETLDLSLSGLAVPDFPDSAPVGARVDLVLELGGSSLHLNGRLERWFEQGGQSVAGLSLLDVPMAAQAQIQTAVEKALSKLPPPWEVEELFGDLSLEEAFSAHALSTRDVSSSPLPAFVPDSSDLELSAVRAVLDGHVPAQDTPEWLIQLAEDLTGVEAAAARGQPAPRWAHDALELRINLARVRYSFPDRPPPSALMDQAYRMFERLKRETQGDTGTMVAQVRKIRAALLRDMVSSPKLGELTSNGLVA